MFYIQSIAIQNRQLISIALVVITLHLLILYQLGRLSEQRSKPSTQIKLAVKTISLKEPKVENTVVKEAPQSVVLTPVPILEVSPPKPSAKKSQKKVVKKEAVKKNISKKKEIVVKNEAKKTERQALLAKAQESIAKIQLTSDNNGAGQLLKQQELKIPEMRAPSAFSSEESGRTTSEEQHYHDELAGRLKLLLRLPEYGEVKIKLTLERSGRFVRLVVVNAVSEINKKYVESALPQLSFPPFGSNFPGIAERSFSITLSHDF